MFEARIFQTFAKVLTYLLKVTHKIRSRTRNATLLQSLAGILVTKQYHLLPVELVTNILTFVFFGGRVF